MKILTEELLKKDWRYRGQDGYLLNKELVKAIFCSSDGDHRHCEFCWQKFSLNSGDLQNGYCTKDRYNWICEDCFNDFGTIFNWIKVE